MVDTLMPEIQKAVAAPWQGKSALAAGRKFLDLLDARRECFTPDIHVNAVILDGGLAPNIIPDYTKIRLEFRTASMGRLEQVDDMIKKCATASSIALDCTVKLELGLSDFADMVRNDVLEQEAEVLVTLALKTFNDQSFRNEVSDSFRKALEAKK